MKPAMALMLVIPLASSPCATALDAKKAAYVGGTVLSLNAAHLEHQDHHMTARVDVV